MSNETRDTWIKSIDEQILELQRQKEELQQMPNESANKDEFIDVSNLLRDANISIQNILMSNDYSADDLFEVHLNHHTKLVRFNKLLSLKIITANDAIIFNHNEYAHELENWLEFVVDRAILISQFAKEFKKLIKNQQDYGDRYQDQFVLRSDKLDGLDIRIMLSKAFEDRLTINMYYDFDRNDIFAASRTVKLDGNFAIEVYGCDPEVYLSYKKHNLNIDQITLAIDSMIDRIKSYDLNE